MLTNLDVLIQNLTSEIGWDWPSESSK